MSPLISISGAGILQKRVSTLPKYAILSEESAEICIYNNREKLEGNNRYIIHETKDISFRY